MQQIFQNILTFAFCDVILFDKHELNVCILSALLFVPAP